MLDPDISTEDALRLLTVADDDPRHFNRRRFLQMMGAGVGAGVLAGSFGDSFGRVAESFAAPIGPTDGILVLVGMFGGSDGLNIVVPYADGNYRTQHGALAFQANQVLQLDASVGLHPNLTFLKSLWDLGEVAVVRGVGYPDPDLSHFSSMAYWMQGKNVPMGVPTDGWIGRWLDGFASDDLLRAVSIGQGLPLHLVGSNRRGAAVPPWGLGFGGDTDPHDLWMYDGIRGFAASSAGRGVWHDRVATTLRDVVDVGKDVGAAFARPLPDSDLERKLTVAARLINADLGMRVVDTGFDGFDTHASQPANLADLMTDLDRALRAFFTTLDDRFRSRVTIMTYSEFGRTSWSNDSTGTDHGTSNSHFVIGRGVKGGLYGSQPSLAGLDRWDRMGFSVDFRSMYASVLDGWMGGGSSTVLGKAYTNLGLFKQSPGQGVASGSLPTRVLGDFVSLTPARLYDSRQAPRRLPLGAGASAEVRVTGVGGVPATGVSAVVLNVTSAGGSEASEFTVWPTGGTKPDVANVAVKVSTAAATAAIVNPGVGGRVNITNDLGSAHLVVDVVGYFRTSAANRLQSITPFRALDTRNGTGGRKGALGPGQSFDPLVRGVSGVPATADSVVLNVTAVTPTRAGYLTVWPSGVARPTTSSLNFAAGAVVPNLVISKVGGNGRVSVYNSLGDTHVVVDVVGYFAAGAPGRFMPIVPTRVLDTLPADVEPLAAASTTAITVRGVGNVPASGVSAVALNIAAANPTAPSYLSVWPSGVARPIVSNLNLKPGAAASNAAVVRLGADGKVLLYNAAGTVDVTVDVVGWFTS